MNAQYVRFGSKADMCAAKRHENHVRSFVCYSELAGRLV
jgi:hypothetical protein